jgi:hypothetical protein
MNTEVDTGPVFSILREKKTGSERTRGSKIRIICTD